MQADNDRLRGARLSHPSPSGSGRPMSRQELADLVNRQLAIDGIRHGMLDATYVGKLERGEHRWPQASYRAAFRAALNVESDAELGFYVARGLSSQRKHSIGTPAFDPQLLRHNGPPPGLAVIAVLRQTLVEVDLSCRTATAAPQADELRSIVLTMRSLRADCEYATFLRRASKALRDVHAATFGPDRKLALSCMVQLCDSVSFVLRHVACPGETWLAAERSCQAAQLLDDPLMLALSAWTQSHAALSCGSQVRALDVATHATTKLSVVPMAGRMREVLGQLHLTRANSLAYLGRRSEAAELLEEAEAIAWRTGETNTFGLMFGPTNVGFWRVSFEAHWGDPAAAMQFASLLRPERVASASRQAAFHLDTAQALVKERRYPDARQALATARELAPQKVVQSAQTRDLVTVLAGQS